ncbi:MAG TPA: FAD-binding oxidoreductase [Stellaceae bacterium]|nr:FAD-binding oxidoreductase [Stellaceae bacterium]
MAKKTVLVVGSGIVGSSIAWHLTRAGCAVTVLDSGDGGGVATPNSFAWLNATWGNPKPYFDLRVRSLREWRRLERELPGLGVKWCGGLLWDLPPDELEAYATEHGRWGYGIRRVGKAEALEIEPNLRNPPELALYVAEEGMVDPLPAARTMLAAAEAAGAKILHNTEVKRLIAEGGRVSGMMTDAGVISADEVVVAAGAKTAQLLDTIGVTLKMDSRPGLLVSSKPTGPLVRGLVLSMGCHIRQTAAGRLLAGSDYGGADPADQAGEKARLLHAKMQAMVRGAEAIELDFHTVGYRPIPADGFPAVGRPGGKPGLYVAVMHSGMTLAPAMGLFATQELLEDVRDPLLAPYHPDRLATSGEQAA